jgi:hypothetical protein
MYTSSTIQQNLGNYPKYSTSQDIDNPRDGVYINNVIGIICKEIEALVRILTSVELKSLNRVAHYLVERVTGSPSFLNLKCWQTGTVGQWTKEVRNSFSA